MTVNRCKGASGIRVFFNFNDCRGPVTLQEGLEKAVREAHRRAGVSVMGFSFRRFPDDTSNFHADLATSHCSGGTYLADRHVAGEVNMCHEDPDNPGHFRDNSVLAWALAKALKREFNPADFVEGDLEARPWNARPRIESAQPASVVPHQDFVRHRAVRSR